MGRSGQVLRYFRKRAKLSAKAFGELYGKTVNADGSAIGERWILNMELDKKVRVDIGGILKESPVSFLEPEG